MSFYRYYSRRQNFQLNLEHIFLLDRIIACILHFLNYLDQFQFVLFGIYFEATLQNWIWLYVHAIFKGLKFSISGDNLVQLCGVLLLMHTRLTLCDQPQLLQLSNNGLVTLVEWLAQALHLLLAFIRINLGVLQLSIALSNQQISIQSNDLLLRFGYMLNRD